MKTRRIPGERMINPLRDLVKYRIECIAAIVMLVLIPIMRPKRALAGLFLGAVLSLGLIAAASAQSVATCNGIPATIVGTNPGRIDGTPRDDVIVGTAGCDQIFGHGGNDTLCAGGGDDTVQWDPSDGSDVVEGEAVSIRSCSTARTPVRRSS
jgi:hypothetical protein